MKHLICLLAAASVFIAADARENTSAETPANAPSSQYSEKGYRRPGKSSSPKFTEKFLNSGKGNSSPENESDRGGEKDRETDQERGRETDPERESGREVGSTDREAGKAGAAVAEVESADPGRKDAPAGYFLDNDLADMVKQACRLGVFVIRQPYGVTDSDGTDYELEDGKLEIGVTYAPAYYIRGGYIFTDQSLSPWAHDPSFADLVEPGMMGKLLDATTSADLSTGAEYDSIPFNASSRGNVYPGLVYSMRDESAFSSDGFYASSEPGDIDGYIVWIIKSPTQELSTDTDLIISAVRKPMTVEDDPAKVYPLGRGVTNAVGAMYVTPEITGVGRIDFYLQGIGVEKDGEWSLVFPFRDFSKIFDKEQAVKAPAEESDRKPGKLRKVLRPKADFHKEEAPLADTPEDEVPDAEASLTESPEEDSTGPVSPGKGENESTVTDSEEEEDTDAE